MNGYVTENFADFDPVPRIADLRLMVAATPIARNHK